jgi:hypothetical protein
MVTMKYPQSTLVKQSPSEADTTKSFPGIFIESRITGDIVTGQIEEKAVIGTAELKFGFNPRLTDVNIEKNFRRAVLRAQRFGFKVVEFSCTESRFEKGLESVFSPYFFEVANLVPEIEYHVHAFYDVQKTHINSLNVRDRHSYIHRIDQVIDFFELWLSPTLYVVHSGAKTNDPLAEQMDALIHSFTDISSRYPEIHIAIENGRSGTLLGAPGDFLRFLENSQDIPFVFDTGLGYNAAQCNQEIYISMLTQMAEYRHRLVEIHWNNMAPSKRNVHNPLHIPLEDGLDFQITMTLLGQSSEVTHLIETPCTSDETLPKERKVLLDAMTWLTAEKKRQLVGPMQLSLFS